MDEVRGRDQPRHAGAVVEAVIAPERRHHVAQVGGGQAAANAFALVAVTRDAGVGVERLAAHGIGGAVELRHLADAESRQELAGRHTGREKLDIGDHRLHLRRFDRQRPPVHAARHARVEAILDGDFGAEPRAVGGKLTEQTEQRNAELLRAGLKMAIAASEIVAGVAVGAPGDFGADLGVGRGDEVAAAPHLATVRVVGQGANFRHGPDRGVRRCARRRILGDRRSHAECRKTKERKHEGDGQMAHGFAFQSARAPS